MAEEAARSDFGELLEQCRRSLESDKRDRLIALVAYYAALASRAEYPEPDVSEDCRLRPRNEILILLLKQLRGYLSTGDPYPTDAFLEAVRERAESADAMPALVWSLEQALNEVSKRS